MFRRRIGFVLTKHLPGGFLFLASLFLSGCIAPETVTSPNYSGENYSRVAVIAVSEQPGTNPGLLRRMEDVFTMEIIGKGYSVVSRSDVDRVLREINFQSSGLTDAGQGKAAQIGKILNVPGIVLVGVNSVAERNHHIPASSGYYRSKKGVVTSYSTEARDFVVASAAVSARLVDVQTTDVLWVGQTNFDGGSSAEDLAYTLARQVAKAYPPRYPKQRR